MPVVTGRHKEDAERLEALMAHLGIVKPGDFAERAGVSPSMVSKMRAGERQAGRDASAKMQRKLGLNPAYWNSKAPYDPAAFLPPEGVTEVVGSARLRAMDLAVKLRLSDGVLAAIVRAKPPTAAQENDPFWWAELVARAAVDESARVRVAPIAERLIELDDLGSPRGRVLLMRLVRGAPMQDLLSAGFQPDKERQPLHALQALVTTLRATREWLFEGTGVAVHDEQIEPVVRPVTYADRLRLAMTLRGFTQTKLAKAARCDVAKIQALLRGAQADDALLPSVIARELRTALDWLGTPDTTMTLVRAG